LRAGEQHRGGQDCIAIGINDCWHHLMLHIPVATIGQVVLRHVRQGMWSRTLCECVCCRGREICL
jgi:hypothetical protein